MENLLEIMRGRRSSRMPFMPDRSIPKGDMNKILEAARWAPTAHNMQNFEITVVDDKQILVQIGEIPGSVSLDFIRENYQQLSFTEEELRRKKTGILGTMFPLTWQTPNPNPDEVEVAGRGLPPTSALLIISYDPGKRAPASEGDFLGIMSLGCVLENIWLMANALGISVHIQSYLSSEEVEREVKSLLGIPDHLKIGISLRLGWALGQPDSLRVRRSLGDFVHHNGYTQNWTE
jgi:nitroreductase